MSTNKTEDGKLNLCGRNVALLRKRLIPKTSQADFAKKLSETGLQMNKTAVQQIESGQRFVTDIELQSIATLLHVSSSALCIDTKKAFSRIAPDSGYPFACCADCKHFRQHYIKKDNKFFAINCGHCVDPRLRKRLPLTAACPNFEKSNTEVFQAIKMQDENQLLCERFRQVRREKKIPLSDLSQRTQIGVATLESIENGTIPDHFTWFEFLILCDALEVEPKAFL